MLIQQVPNYCTYLFIDFLKLKLTKKCDWPTSRSEQWFFNLGYGYLSKSLILSAHEKNNIHKTISLSFLIQVIQIIIFILKDYEKLQQCKQAKYVVLLFYFSDMFTGVVPDCHVFQL